MGRLLPRNLERFLQLQSCKCLSFLIPRFALLAPSSTDFVDKASLGGDLSCTRSSHSKLDRVRTEPKGSFNLLGRSMKSCRANVLNPFKQALGIFELRGSRHACIDASSVDHALQMSLGLL